MGQTQLLAQSALRCSELSRVLSVVQAATCSSVLSDPTCQRSRGGRKGVSLDLESDTESHLGSQLRLVVAQLFNPIKDQGSC